MGHYIGGLSGDELGLVQVGAVGTVLVSQFGGASKGHPILTLAHWPHPRHFGDPRHVGGR